MRLSCSASALFSFSAMSSIASFATYSTSCSLIFIGKSDLLDPRRWPRLIYSSQYLRPHLNELFSPYLIGYVDHDTRAVYGRHMCCRGQLDSNQCRPKLP